jgi:hypothetical protein
VKLGVATATATSSSSDRDVWPMVRNEGVVIFGSAIDDLVGVVGG